MRLFAVTAAVTAGLLVGPAARPIQTVPATASIAGAVVTAGASASPVRRAVVTLRGTGLGTGRIAVTDDEGQFTFGGLPAGRFTLSAARPGFVTTHYGSLKAGRGPGMPIAVSAGEQLDDISVGLMPGAVVAGRILDHIGRPQRRAVVSLLEAASIDGEAGFAAAAQAKTDDLGEFRLWGLRPGRYILAVQPGFSFNGAVMPPAAEIDAVLADVAGLARPGAVRPASAEPERIGYGPTFFPGATDIAQAAPIDLDAGDERLGFDVRLRFVRTTRVEGQVVAPDRGAPADVVLSVEWPGDRWGLDWKTYMGTSPMAGGATVRQDGRFALPALTPGRYVFFARSGALWGQAMLEARGQPSQEISIGLQPGMTVDGRVRPAADAGALPDVRKLPLALRGRIAGMRMDIPPARIRADGHFTFADVPPGSYRLVAGTLDDAGRRWVADSAALAHLDVLDEPMDVMPGVPTTGIEVELTDRLTALAGLLVDGLGRPAPDYHVVVFAADRRQWTAGNRRTGRARPAQDGTFEFIGLPPGHYLVAAVTALLPGDLDDPAFLDLLAASARPVELRAGETRTLNLQLALARD